MDLSQRLIQLKNERNLLQKNIAKDVGLALRTYQYYERGERKPDSDTLIKLADYFGCSIDYLVGKIQDENIAKIIGDNIFNLRKERNLLQKDIAEAVGVSVSAISQFEKGTLAPSVSVLAYISRFFGVNVDSMIYPQINRSDSLEDAEDEWLANLVLERKKTDSGVRISWEEHLARHGMTQEELDAMEDVEIE